MAWVRQAMRLDLEIFGDKQVDRELLRFRERADDMRPVFTALADDFLNMERAQFRSQGLFGSGGWAPLKQSTVDRKAAAGLDPRILHATLALYQSLTSSSDQHHVRRVTGDSLVVGTDLLYAGVHQNPVTSPLPQRRPVEFREQDRRAWIKALQSFLVNGTIELRGAARI